MSEHNRTRFLVNDVIKGLADISAEGKTPGRIIVDGETWFELIRVDWVYRQVSSFYSTSGEMHQTLFGIPVLIGTIMKHNPGVRVEALEDYNNFAHLKWKRKNEDRT
jgi:hypothetical protein